MKIIPRIVANSLILAGTTGFVITAAAGASAGEQVTFQKTAENFIVMYDSSSSMGDAYGQTDLKEIDAERKILMEKAATLPELDWQAGIYSFTPGWSMGYFKPFLSLRTYNKDEFTAAIKTLPTSPSGATPLQGGLAGLEQELDSVKLAGRTVVFLFTDGQYTGQPGFPSPVTTAESIAAKHDVCFQVIATSEDKADFKTIKAIGAVNECSAVVPFEGLVGHPEWLTDILFSVRTLKPSEDTADKVVGQTMGKVRFAFDKADINRESADALIELSIYLNENPTARVVLAGHTDNMGSSEYNMKLSQRRAENARKYLVEKMNIDQDRITLSWFGKDEPAASNDSEEGRAENRRVTAVITNM